MQTLNFTAFKLATLWLGLFIVLYQPAVFAAVYKCTDAKGNLTYSDRPCQIDSQSETIKLKGTPPPFNPEDYCQAVFEADYTLEGSFYQQFRKSA